MTLAIDKIDELGLSGTCRECLAKKTKLMSY